MTKRMILRRRWMLPAVLLALLLLPTPAVQADTLPKGVVAIVGGKRLTFEGFCTAAAQQARMDLRQSRSGPRSVLDPERGLLADRSAPISFEPVGFLGG